MVLAQAPGHLRAARAHLAVTSLAADRRMIATTPA